jgi:Ca2+/H+ antiporter, TMEM165/GDT1 family
VELSVIALTFAAIFLVELPDKTFLATLVLATRYRPLLVWIGVGLAFLVQTMVAVAFGQAVSLLPGELVRAVAGVMFLVGAIILFRTARNATSAEEAAHEFDDLPTDTPAGQPASRVVATCFLVLFAAEWGDLSQILTLTLAAKYDEPLSVFVGAWGALLLVSALAAIVGQALLKRVRLSLLHYIGASICLFLAMLTAWELFG